MAKGSERKRQRKTQRADLHQARQRRKLELLDLLGIRETIKGTLLESFILESYGPDVRIDFASEVPNSSERTVFSEQLNAALDSATFDCPLLGSDFAASEYLTIVAPMMHALHNSRWPDSELKRIQSNAKGQTSAVEDRYTALRAICSICENMVVVLIERSQMDRAIYFVSQVHDRNDKNQRFVTITVHRHIQIPVTINLDKEPRPSFRCGAAEGIHGIKWCDWEPSVLGLEDPDLTYPVYVQSHVFRRLESRLGIFPEWLLQDWLWQSLRAIIVHPEEFKLIPTHDRRQPFLAKYVILGHHVGYVGVVIHEKKIVVRTFLLITMEGTPEGDRFQQRVKLCRDAKDWLGLNRLETFVLSDIPSDPVLSTILEECGCGQLLRMLKEPIDEVHLKKRASEIRTFLRTS